MFGALFALAAAQAADPLAEARAGKIQCFTPDTVAKKCQAITRYAFRTDGGFDATVTVLIAPAPLIAMDTKVIGKVEGDAVCSVVRRSDYAASTFAVDGKPADAATANAILPQLLNQVAALDGKKACSRDRKDGEIWVEEVTLDGVARPDMTQKFLWVKPEDGYAVK
jgi:hypothetical protein